MWSVQSEQKSSVIEAGKGKPRRVYGSGSIRSTNVSRSCLPHALSVKSEQFLRQPILDRILSLPVYSWSSHSFFGGGFDIYASVLLTPSCSNREADVPMLAFISRVSRVGHERSAVLRLECRKA